MGRKIPARKHHGVRDPLKQAAERLALIKDKINHPPEKSDYQKVSHTFSQFIRLKDEAKSGKIILPKRQIEDIPENYKNSKKSKNPSRNNKELPNIRRFQNEDDTDYMRRVTRITRESINEAKFEAKYGVEVVRNEKTGEIKMKKRPPNEIDVVLKEAEQNAKNTKKMGGNFKQPKKMPEAEKKALVKEMMKKKKKEKKEKKIVDTAEEKQFDDIKFGEVVHAPPTLCLPRRAKKVDTVPRPGTKKSLLLHTVLESNNQSNSDNQENNNGKSKKKSNLGVKKTTEFKSMDLKGKRKDLSASTREMIEKQQQDVMSLYKELKKSNRKLNIV